MDCLLGGLSNEFRGCSLGGDLQRIWCFRVAIIELYAVLFVGVLELGTYKVFRSSYQLFTHHYRFLYWNGLLGNIYMPDGFSGGSNYILGWFHG